MTSKSMNIESMLNSSLDDIVKMQKGSTLRGGLRGRGRGQRSSNFRGRVIKNTFKASTTRGSWGRRGNFDRGGINDRSRNYRRGASASRGRMPRRGYSQAISSRSRGRGSAGSTFRPSNPSVVNSFRSRNSFGSRGTQRGRGSVGFRGRMPMTPRSPNFQRGRPRIIGRGTRASSASFGSKLAASERKSALTSVRKTAIASKALRPNISLNRRLDRVLPNRSTASSVRSQNASLRAQPKRSTYTRRKLFTPQTGDSRNLNKKEIGQRVKGTPTDAELMSRIKILAELDKVPSSMSSQDTLSFPHNAQKPVKSLSDRFSRF